MMMSENQHKPTDQHAEEEMDVEKQALYSSAEHERSSSFLSNSAVLACGLYSFCSVSMVLVNKSLASR